MYGLVPKALEELVLQEHGPETWARICARAGHDPDGFLSFEDYPDDLVFGVVGAAAAELETSVDALLVAFGEHWVQFTGREGYGALLDACGPDVETFLHGLDELHDRVAATFPALRPPHFECTTVESGRLHLHYHSERTGLASMVVGLLRGLGRRLVVDLEIEHVGRAGEGQDHDVFEVRVPTRSGA